MSHRLLPKLTSSFTSLFPHTEEEPRTEKQSKAWMAEDRIFMLVREIMIVCGHQQL
jgi:hypothetical protein